MSTARQGSSSPERVGRKMSQLLELPGPGVATGAKERGVAFDSEFLGHEGSPPLSPKGSVRSTRSSHVKPAAVDSWSRQTSEDSCFSGLSGPGSDAGAGDGKGAGFELDLDAIEAMDDMFDDGSAAKRFVDVLINSDRLKSSWTELLRRLEDHNVKIFALQKFCDYELLAHRFVKTDLYNTQVGGCQEHILSHAQQIHVNMRRMDDNEKADIARDKLIGETIARTSRLEELADLARADIDKHKEEALGRHEEILRMLGLIDERFDRRTVEINRRLGDINSLIEKASEDRAGMHQDIERMQDFLSGETLQKHIETVCKSLLNDYVKWEAMPTQKEEIHSRAELELVRPVRENIDHITGDLDTMQKTVSRNLDHADAANANTTRKLHEEIDKTMLKISGVMEEVYKRVQITELDASKKLVDDALKAGVEATECLNTAMFKKVEEIVGRLMDLQDISTDHEHCLQHQAEEIGTRATKYDLVVCQQRIDKCALKDRVEGEYDELKKQLEWQLQKMSTLGFGGGIGGGSYTENEDDDDGERDRADSRESAMLAGAVGGGGAEAPGSPTATPRTPRNPDGHPDELESGGSKELSSSNGGKRAAPLFKRSNSNSSMASGAGGAAGMQLRGGNMGGGRANKTNVNSGSGRAQQEQADGGQLNVLMHQQLEAMAQGVLTLAHASLRQPVLGGSRQMRIDREMSLLDHLKSVLHWVTHRKAPHSWDPTKLTTLALECAQFSDSEKKRALAIHATSRNHDSVHSGPSVCAGWPTSRSNNTSKEDPSRSCQSTEAPFSSISESGGSRFLTYGKKPPGAHGQPERSARNSSSRQFAPLTPRQAPDSAEDVANHLVIGNPVTARAAARAKAAAGAATNVASNPRANTAPGTTNHSSSSQPVAPHSAWGFGSALPPLVGDAGATSARSASARGHKEGDEASEDGPGWG